jgi:hypothetical protein
LQLPYEHVGQTQTLALRQLHRDLVVEHVLIHVALVAAEQRVLAEALVRFAHALEQHLREQALELARRFLQRCRCLCLRIVLQGREALEVREERDVGGATHSDYSLSAMRFKSR